MIAALLFAGCANPQIVQVSPDTYMLMRQDHAGVFGNPLRMQADVIGEASAFAMKQGKVAVPVSSKSSPAWPGHFASFEYQFRVVPRESPEAQHAVLLPKADLTIQKTENITVDRKISQEPKKSNDDVYNDLLKLDQLRSKKIITNAEFETRKKKILGEN
ncbi:MAG: SHOCT domain-containing protein [Proteobacteria bacterium]|nr:MAG: SHOCT domain-containing protein [Pseudomonadota bacterium]